MLLLPHSTSFSGHETFPFRYAWLKKAYDAVSRDPEIFGREDAMVFLGVGKNMVRSIRHWALSAGVVQEDSTILNNRGRRLVATAWGRQIFSSPPQGEAGFDPYLEDIATLWLLHWRIVTSPARNTTWYWTFSHWKGLEFTKEKLLSSLLTLAGTSRSTRVQDSSLKRDIDCFIRTYVPGGPTKGVVTEDSLDCPLVELGLISESVDRSSYRFHVGRQNSLPNELFAYALIDFWERRADGRETLSFEDIAYAPLSPGRVFKIDDEGLISRLEHLEATTKGAIAFDQTAGLRQLYRRGSCSRDEMLQHYYRMAPELVGGCA